MSSTAIIASKPTNRRTRSERTTDLSESRNMLKHLKRDIELDRYDPDPGAVADAILTKLRLVRRGRLALVEGGADQSRPVTERRRGDL
jgi:hypothetical protein